MSDITKPGDTIPPTITLLDTGSKEVVGVNTVLQVSGFVLCTILLIIANMYYYYTV